MMSQSTLQTMVNSAIGGSLTVIIVLVHAPAGAGALLGGMLAGALEEPNFVDGAAAGALSGLFASILLISLGLHPIESQFLPAHFIGWFLTLLVYILTASTIGGTVGGYLQEGVQRAESDKSTIGMQFTNGIPRWFIIGAILSIVLSFGMIGLLFWPETPCNDNLDTTPTNEFNISSNQTSLTIVHERGDRLTEKNTDSLTVQIRPIGGTEYIKRYTLASDSKGGYPVKSGDQWTIRNPSVNGRSLQSGDTIRIFWVGPDDIPSHCPNSKPEEATLEKHSLDT